MEIDKPCTCGLRKECKIGIKVFDNGVRQSDVMACPKIWKDVEKMDEIMKPYKPNRVDCK